MRAMPEKCDLPEKNAFNASILFQKSSECKKCFFNAGTIARSLYTVHPTRPTIGTRDEANIEYFILYNF